VVWPPKPQLSKAFLLGRVSVGFLSQYFCIFIFSMTQEKMQQDECTHIYFYFCATTVNVPMGSYTPQNYSHGALGLLMQQINIFIFFYFLFLMQC
jgi:hypothetical protein